MPATVTGCADRGAHDAAQHLTAPKNLLTARLRTAAMEDSLRPFLMIAYTSPREWRPADRRRSLADAALHENPAMHHPS